jgi:hypothetical protein
MKLAVPYEGSHAHHSPSLSPLQPFVAWLLALQAMEEMEALEASDPASPGRHPSLRGGTGEFSAYLARLMCLAATGRDPIYLNLADLYRDLELDIDI